MSRQSGKSRAIVVTRRSLGKPIVNAPVARDPPRLNGIVGASNPDFFKGSFQYFATSARVG